MMVKAFLLLEVDFSESSLKNTIRRDTGEPHQPHMCAEIIDFRDLQQCFPTGITGPERQIAEVNYIVQYLTAR